MDQHATWYAGRPRPRRLCVRLQTAKIAPRMHRNSPFYLKIEKKILGRGTATSLGADCVFGPSTLWCPQTRERKFQGMKYPGNERALERKRQGANRPWSYCPIRSGERIGPGAKRLGTVRRLSTGDDGSDSTISGSAVPEMTSYMSRCGRLSEDVHMSK